MRDGLRPNPPKMTVIGSDRASESEGPAQEQPIANIAIATRRCLPSLGNVATCFTRLPAPHTPISRETWPIRSKRFRRWLRRRHYQSTGESASPAIIRSALDLFEARAQFDGSERAVHIRTPEHAGHFYLDLADEQWRAVQIGPEEWRVIEAPPVRFRRPAGMLALPPKVPAGQRAGSHAVAQSAKSAMRGSASRRT
jgi:hypothetical protein